MELQSQTKVAIGKTIQCFSVLFIKHCTNGRSTCSKFSLLPCYMPIDSSLGNAKLLSCQPQGQLFGLQSFLGRFYSELLCLY